MSDDSSGNDAVGDYSLHLAKATGADENEGGELFNGFSVSDELTLGDLDSYAFEPNALGANVVITVTETGVEDFNPRIDLFSPSGAYLGSADGPVQATLTRNLSELGVYTLVVSDDSSGEDAIGNYQLSVVGNVSAVGGNQPPVVLDNPDPQPGDRLGYSTAIDGDYAAVGIRLDDAGGLANSGSVEIYQLVGGTWTNDQTLVSSLAGAQFHFGHAVGLSGNWLVVGEETNNNSGFRAGAVHLFERSGNNWTSQNVILGNNARDYYGRSVSIDGNSIVVGILNADDYGANSGAAEVIDFNAAGTVIGTYPLVPNDAVAGDNFGNAVSISGDYALVGSFRDDDSAIGAGSAYIFHRNQGGSNNWGQLAKLVASNPVALDQYGYSVSNSGDTVAIGSRLSDSATANQIGTVYVYRGVDTDADGILDDWSDETRLTADDAVAGDRLGSSVAIDGNRLLSGAPARDEFGDKSGIAYLFKRNGVVGSWLDNVPGANNSGRAYIFELF